MTRENPLPDVWILSDERSENRLDHVLITRRSPTGLVFRHYHLPMTERMDRFAALRDIARQKGHTVVLARDPELARQWGADGVYGALPAIAEATDMLRLATAHDAAEVDAANAAKVDGIFLSPVFPTRSHPGGATLGAMGFHVLAQRATVPVIALGGMNEKRAAELGWRRWGAIDAFSKKHFPTGLSAP